MTTTGWIIWFAALGLGSIAVVLIARSIARGMVRDQEERERRAREEHPCG